MTWSKSVRIVTSSAAFLLVVSAVLIGGASAASAAPRTADSAGSAAVGTASYAAPSGAVYVSPSGSDSNPGTPGAPVRTLNRALTVVPASGTVVMRGGSYQEYAAIYKSVTIQNYPGEAVWMDGSVQVSGWVQDGSRWRKDGWTTRFDHSPTYTQGAPDSTTPYWQFVNPGSAPMAAHPDQVFIDGVPQAQVQTLAKLTANSFYLDEGTSRLYLGSNPNGRRVDASTVKQALNIRAANVVVRGIGIRRYSPSVFHVGAVTLEKPAITLENVVISDMATTGLSVQSSGAQLRRVTVDRSGMLGVHGRHADNLTFDRVLAKNNNSERFNIAPVSGGVKLGATRGVNVVDSNFSNNLGPGFWNDMSIYNSTFRRSNFNGNAGDGLFLEISARAIVADNLFLRNKLDGIKVNNTSNVKIWNNTFLGNSRSMWLVQDARRNTNRGDPAVDSRIAWPDPEMPWQLDDVTVSNNVIGLPGGSANCVVCVEDFSAKESAESMRVKINGNVYSRTSASSPTWLTIWTRGAGNPYVFTTLAAWKSTTGQEARGREYVGSAIASTSDGALSSSVQSLASQIAVGLPSDVASLIGRPAGAAYLGAWVDSGGAPAPSPTTPVPTTPAPTPTTPAPPPTSQPPTGSVIAKDDFGRTVGSGWGSADVGGSWSVPAGSGQFSVGGGGGQIKLNAGDGFAARLSSVSSTKSDVRLATSLDRYADASGQFVNVIGRSVNGVGDYRAKVRVAASGSVAVWLLKTVGSTETVFASTAVPGLSVTPGQALLFRFQATGTNSTSLNVKTWKAGSAEPANWTLTASDNTAGLQTAGSIGVYAYSGAPVTVYFDGLSVTG